MKLNPEYNYESEFSLDAARQRLREYFSITKQQENNKRYAFSGLFTSDNEFELRSKMQMMFSKPPYKKPAYIRGQLSQSDAGKLKVKLLFTLSAIWSPFHLVIFFLAPFFVFLFPGSSSASGLITVLVLYVVQGTIITIGIIMTHRREKKRIEHLLGLRPLPNFQ